MTKFNIGDIVYDSYTQPYKNWEALVQDPYTIKDVYDYTNTTDYLIESDRFQGIVNEKELYETPEEAYTISVKNIAKIEKELRGKLKTINDVVAIYTNPNKYSEELKEKISREVVKKEDAKRIERGNTRIKSNPEPKKSTEHYKPFDEVFILRKPEYYNKFDVKNGLSDGCYKEKLGDGNHVVREYLPDESYTDLILESKYIAKSNKALDEIQKIRYYDRVTKYVNKIKTYNKLLDFLKLNISKQRITRYEQKLIIEDSLKNLSK
jgi:hypothetical protein